MVANTLAGMLGVPSTAGLPARKMPAFSAADELERVPEPVAMIEATEATTATSAATRLWRRAGRRAHLQDRNVHARCAKMSNAASVLYSKKVSVIAARAASMRSNAAISS